MSLSVLISLLPRTTDQGQLGYLSMFPLGQALHFCGMVDKSLPLSSCISSSIKYRAWPPPQVLIVVPSLRVAGSRGQSQATMICCGCLLTGMGLPPYSCCEGPGCLAVAPPLLPEDVGQDYSIS